MEARRPQAPGSGLQAHSAASPRSGAACAFGPASEGGVCAWRAGWAAGASGAGDSGAGDSGADPTEGICSDSRVELPHQRQQEGLQCSQEQHQHQALFHMQQANGAHPGPSPALRGGIDTQNTAFGNHFPVPAAAAAMDTLLSFHRASLHSHRPSSPGPGRPSAAWQMKGVSTSPAHPDPSSTKREDMQGAADVATHPTGTDKHCKQTNALRPSAPSSSSRNLWR